MTLTSPNCPAAQSMPAEVEYKTRSLDGVGEVTVEVVWDPPWATEHMSEAARPELGMMKGRKDHGCNRDCRGPAARLQAGRSEEHTSELQSLMRHTYAVF